MSEHPMAAVLVSLVVFAAALTLSLCIGAVAVGPMSLVALASESLGWVVTAPLEARERAVIVAIRLPRAILGTTAGASLAMAGAAMQSLFRNPLADPGIVGVSSGAALAAAAAIVFGLAADGHASGTQVVLLPLVAFAGGLAATMLVVASSRVARDPSPSQLLLAGLAVNALAGAATGLLVFVASDAQLRSLTFWNLGSLGGATWSAVMAAVPWMVIALMALPRLASGMDALLLGEAEAEHLGFDVDRLKRQMIVLSAVGVGAAVSVCGVIGFVGLVVPHVTRLWLGPRHGRVLPVAAILGAALLLTADVAARTLAAPAEIPIGVFTALVGGPFLLALLQRASAVGEP